MAWEARSDLRQGTGPRRWRREPLVSLPSDRTTGRGDVSALEFLGSLVSSLAWPVLVLVLVLFLKTPLTNLLSAERDGRRIASFKAGPSGLEIQYALDRAEADL